MPHFFKIFGNLRAGIFFLQLLDDAIHQHRSRFLFEVAHLAGQFARKRKRFAVDNREFLAKLIVLSLEFFGGDVFQFPVLHHLGDFFDRHHLPFDYRENFRQRDRAHLHTSQRELFARDAAREVVHQFFFAHRVTFHDARLLPLERFAFEHLRNAPPQKIDSGLHFFLERIGSAARQGQQARPVRVLEIVDVAAIRRKLALRVHLLDHAHDHAAAARPGKPANEQVVSRGGHLHAHPQRPQRAVLPHVSRSGFNFRGGLEGNSRGIAAPAQLFRRQALIFRVVRLSFAWDPLLKKIEGFFRRALL